MSHIPKFGTAVWRQEDRAKSGGTQRLGREEKLTSTAPKKIPVAYMRTLRRPPLGGCRGFRGANDQL